METSHEHLCRFYSLPLIDFLTQTVSHQIFSTCFFFQIRGHFTGKSDNFVRNVINIFQTFSELASCAHGATASVKHTTFLALNENFIHPNNVTVYSLSKTQMKFKLTGNVGSRPNSQLDYVEIGKFYLKVYRYELIKLIIKLFVI